MVPKLAFSPLANEAAIESAVAVSSSLEPQQLRRGGGGAEDAERGGGVPALVVVVEVDGEPDLALHLEARDVGEQQLAAARSVRLAEGEQRGHERRRGVPAERCR